jgi:hypothetical protein
MNWGEEEIYSGIQGIYIMYSIRSITGDATRYAGILVVQSSEVGGHSRMEKRIVSYCTISLDRNELTCSPVSEICQKTELGIR